MMFKIADVTRSSPLAENVEGTTPASSAARAPSSTPSSFRSRYLSPTQLSRRFSISPLSARSTRDSRAVLRPVKSVSKLAEFKRKMSTPTTPAPNLNTAQGRRGLRPLSITNSTLLPFDFDPIRTMENAQSNQYDLPSPPKMSPVTGRGVMTSRPPTSSSIATGTPVTTPSPTYAGSVKGKGKARAVDPFEDDLDNLSISATEKTPLLPDVDPEREQISVAEFMRRDEIDEAKNKSVLVADDYPAFYKLPPPDSAKHPAFNLDPFNCNTHPPPMTTNWTSYQIKQWTADKYLRDRGMLPEQSPESKKSIKDILPFDRKSPDKEKTNIHEALNEGSVVPATSEATSERKVPQTPQTPRTPRRDTIATTASSASRIASSIRTTVTDDFDKKTGGLRSLSNLFKPRSSTETKPSTSTLKISSPLDPNLIHPAATPDLRRYDLVSHSDSTLTIAY